MKSAQNNVPEPRVCLWVKSSLLVPKQRSRNAPLQPFYYNS